MPSKKPCSASKLISVIFITLFLASVATQPAHAQTFKVLHTFHGPNGAGPVGRLARDSAGNLYGTTGAGGAGRCNGSFDNRCGTAFKLDKTGKQVWLHSFQGWNGMAPLAGLLRDSAGNLYGTTYLGGDTTCHKLGCGTVFKLDSNGKETLLYKFIGTPNGWFTAAGLVRDAAGNLYGDTQQGGSSGSGYGTVFKVDRTGKETVLYSFAGGSDGIDPYATLVRDSAGNLYGVTVAGGGTSCEFGCGTVFEVDTAGKETVLYRFQGGADGSNPNGGLLLDGSGNLYGTTNTGGEGPCDAGNGCGTVFRLDTSGKETVLYRFSGGTDGEFPEAGVVRDNAGNLYGTTVFGGAYRNCNGDACGVIFKLDTAGNETVLHSFSGSDGAQPTYLTRDSAGNLYGVAEVGGDTKNCFPPDGCGVVFRLMP
jgi:uncharacterized repeat protein (TIGR03803 family)